MFADCFMLTFIPLWFYSLKKKRSFVFFLLSVLRIF